MSCLLSDWNIDCSCSFGLSRAASTGRRSFFKSCGFFAFPGSWILLPFSPGISQIKAPWQPTWALLETMGNQRTSYDKYVFWARNLGISYIFWKRKQIGHLCWLLNMLSGRLWMFVRESPDDQCTIINIVASDCICSDVFKRTLVLYVAFTFCRKVSHQRPWWVRSRSWGKFCIYTENSRNLSKK